MAGHSLAQYDPRRDCLTGGGQYGHSCDRWSVGNSAVHGQCRMATHAGRPAGRTDCHNEMSPQDALTDRRRRRCCCCCCCCSNRYKQPSTLHAFFRDAETAGLENAGPENVNGKLKRHAAEYRNAKTEQTENAALSLQAVCNSVEEIQPTKW